MDRIPLVVCIMLCSAAVFLPGDSPYTLTPDDVIEISVYAEPDLKTVTRVSRSGEISFPLLETLKIAGLTTEEAENLIEKKLKQGNFLKNPQVTVYIREYAKLKVYVYGAVKNPGSFSFERETPSVLKAIALAGGLTEKAYETDIRIIRRGGKETYRTFTTDLKKLTMGIDGKYDIPLRDGDIINVPEAPPVYVFGEVSKEGIINYMKDMRILQAVTMAGGFTEKVNPKKIMVLRLDETTLELKTIMINFEEITKKADRKANIVIQPYDIIIAPESWL